MNITEHERSNMRLFAARTGAKDVVTVQGSVFGGYLMLDKQLSMAPRLATSILDAGTKSRSKDDIRSALASRGASIYFSAGGDRTYFRATCLPDDLDFVLKLIAECLGDAIFPAAEVIAQKKRTLAELNEMKTETRSLASDEFYRLVYDKNHANYTDSLAVDEARVKKSTRADLRAYQELVGKGGLLLAVVGDIRPDQALASAERAFTKLGTGTTAMIAKRQNVLKPSKRESRISVADKANIDMFMGAHVPLTYDSPEFLPFVVLTSMLGGSGLFGGHLMRTIRERDGLTYGIRAMPVGFGGLADGAIRIWATFSPSTYEKAVAATVKEVGVFLDTGITEQMLDAKKGEMTGKYIVGLGTTNGLASALHSIGEEGKPLSYIEEYPSLINAVTVKDLKKAASLVPWNSFVISAAGTFEKKR